MSTSKINHEINGEKVVVNGTPNIHFLRPIVRSDDLGIYSHDKSKTIIIVHYKDKQMIKCDESSAPM